MLSSGRPQAIRCGSRPELIQFERQHCLSSIVIHITSLSLPCVCRSYSLLRVVNEIQKHFFPLHRRFSIEYLCFAPAEDESLLRHANE